MEYQIKVEKGQIVEPIEAEIKPDTASYFKIRHSYPFFMKPFYRYYKVNNGMVLHINPTFVCMNTLDEMRDFTTAIPITADEFKAVRNETLAKMDLI